MEDRQSNFTIGEKENEQEISIYDLRKAFLRNPNLTAEFLEEILNCFSDASKYGERVGEITRGRVHFTGQRSMVCFALGILSGMGTHPEWTDPRNADAISAAVKVRQLVESGEINPGIMI